MSQLDNLIWEYLVSVVIKCPVLGKLAKKRAGPGNRVENPALKECFKHKEEPLVYSNYSWDSDTEGIRLKTAKLYQKEE